MPSKFADIYQTLQDACRTCRFRRPWDFLECRDDCRRVVNAEAVTSSLLEKFNVDQLVAAKVLVGAADGAQRLNPKLSADGGWLVFLRDVNGECFDVVCARGCLSGQVPIFSMLEDGAMRDAAAASANTICLASSVLDLILLRSLGIPASLATGLSRLTFRGLAKLIRVMDGGPLSYGELDSFGMKILPEYDCHDELDPDGACLGEPLHIFPTFDLILIAGSLHQRNREVPTNVPRICRFLTDAARYLRCDWLDFFVWRPSVDELAELDFRLQRRESRLICNFVLAERQCDLLADYVDPNGPATPSPASKLSAAWSKYCECLKVGSHNGDDARRLREAENSYRQAIDDFIIQPQLTEALRSTKPAIRSLGVQLAHVAQQLHEMMPKVSMQMSREVANWESVAAQAEQKYPAHKMVTELSHLMVKLVRELRRERGSGWGRDT